MNDLKNSTLGERILLGIIAGLFAIGGFYVGYEHLSNGVSPWLIGGITAFIVMIGCMAAAFIIEELIRKIPARKKYEKERTEPLFDAGSKLPAGEKFEDEEVKVEPANLQEVKSVPAKRMTLMPSLKEQRLKKEAEASKPVIEKEAVVSSPEWDEEEIIVPQKPVPPVKPNVKQEESAESLKLTDFIKAHPDLSARKMVKEYRLAGGTDSTEDILNLMN